MNTNKTEMAMKLKRKLQAYKASLQFGYFTTDNVLLNKDKLCGKKIYM